MRKTVIEKELKELNGKIAHLEKDALERTFRKYFYDEQGLKEKLLAKEDQENYFEDLPEMVDEKSLTEVLEKDVTLDFSIVNFKKIFMEGNLKDFTKRLLKDEKKLSDHPQYRVQYVFADEESGKLSYRIGIYA